MIPLVLGWGQNCTVSQGSIRNCVHPRHSPKIHQVQVHGLESLLNSGLSSTLHSNVGPGFSSLWETTGLCFLRPVCQIWDQSHYISAFSFLYRKTNDSKNNGNKKKNSNSHSNTFPCFTCSFPSVFPPELKKKNTILHWAQIVAVLTTVNYVPWFSSGRNWAFKHKPSNYASIVHSLMSMRKSSFSVNQDPSQRIPSSHF